MSALRRDGSEFPVELSVSPLKTGEAVTFCGFVTDITERKEAEIKLKAQLSRLNLLHRIVRAIGERQDLASIFQVIIRSLEDDLPIDFGCVCLYDPDEEVLTVTSVGVRSADAGYGTGLDRAGPRRHRPKRPGPLRSRPFGL